MDLKIATANVSISGGTLPNVEPQPEYKDLDIVVTDDPRQFNANSQGASDGIEITQDVSGNWAIAHCARRYTQRPNLVQGGSSTAPSVANAVTWTASDSLPPSFASLLENQSQGLTQPSGGGYPTSYTGPRWRNVYIGTQSQGVDDSNLVGTPSGTTGQATQQANNVFYKYSTAAQQSQTSPGIWWGAEANVGYAKGEGCWVDIQRSGEKPTQGQASWVLVLINGANGLAVFMTTNKRPKIVNMEKQTQEDMSTVGTLSAGSSVRLGILSLCGRIIFNFNGADYVYTLRADSSSGNSGSNSTGVEPDQFDFQPIEDFEISDIAVYGTNCQAILSVADMTFTKGTLRTPAVGSIDNDSGQATGGYEGDLFTIETGTGAITYGASSEDHAGGGGTLTVEWVDSSNRDNKVANIILTPGGDDKLTPAVSRMFSVTGAGNVGSRGGNGGTRSRGVSIRGNKSLNVTRGSGDVLAVNMTFSAPDYYHSKQSAEVTIYNPGGAHDSWLDKSQGITIECGWGSAKKLFTGVTLGGYRSETAGLETLVINCEDYMFILDSCMMINSPYYDGFYAYDAVANLAMRAGIMPVDDSQGQPYALPQGYSFARPLFRFSKGRTIKDCILDVVKQTECTIFFDADGIMHYADIQGGINYGAGASSSAGSIDAAPSGENMILDEFRTEVRLSSAINCVFVESVDRTSGNPIYITRYAQQNNLFGFLKPGFNPQSAFGSWQAANSWLDMITQRVFKAPRAVTVKTASDAAITPMTTITVGGKPYRVTSLQRSYRADENSLTTTVSGEWYG